VSVREGVLLPGPNIRPAVVQAILLTTSLLLVAGMLGSLAWLTALRVRAEVDPAQADTNDDER